MTSIVRRTRRGDDPPQIAAAAAHLAALPPGPGRRHVAAAFGEIIKLIDAKSDEARADSVSVCRALATLGDVLSDLKGGMMRIEARQEKEEAERKDFLKGVQETHERCVRLVFESKCPCCRRNEILDANGALKTAFAQREHMYSREMRDLEHTWLVCTECHGKKRSNVSHFEAKFKSYQLDLSEFLKGPGHGSGPGPQATLWNR